MAHLKLYTVGLLTTMLLIGNATAQENDINMFALDKYSSLLDEHILFVIKSEKLETPEDKNTKKKKTEDVDGFWNSVYTYSTEPFSADNWYEMGYLSLNTYALHALDERVAREMDGNSTFNEKTVTFGLPRGSGLGDGSLLILTTAAVGSYAFVTDDDKWTDAFKVLATGCMLVMSTEVQIMKLSGRDRPKRSSGVSFPGGGASSGACSAAVTYRFFGAKVGIPMSILAFGVGAGRMGQNEHWLTDTVFGWGFGALMGWQYSGYSEYALYKDAYEKKGIVHKYPIFVEVQPAHNTIASGKIVFGGGVNYDSELGEYGVSAAVVTRKGRMENWSKITSYPSVKEFRLITKINLSNEGKYWPQVAALLEVENHTSSEYAKIEGFANAGLAISKKISSLGIIGNLNIGYQYGSRESYDGTSWGVSVKKKTADNTSMFIEVKKSPELRKIKQTVGFMTRIASNSDIYGKIGYGGNGETLAEVGAQWRFDSKF